MENMTDKYQRLRAALAAGPTPGEWDHDFASAMRNGSPAVVEYFVRRDGEDISIAADIVDPESGLPSSANAAYIAAASPEIIDALLAERDALRDALTFVRRGIESGHIEFSPIVLDQSGCFKQERRRLTDVVNAALGDAHAHP